MFCEHHSSCLKGCPIQLFSLDLPDASIDVVIACQCFHWFANSAALEEIHRVLKTDGYFGIFWAITDFSVPWTARVWEFLAPLYKEKSIVYPPSLKITHL